MDTIWIRLSMSLAFMAGLFLWGAGYLSPRYDSYSLPIAEVHETLSRTPLPPVVFGSEMDSGAPQFTSVFPTNMKVEMLPEPGEEDGMPRNFDIDAADPTRVVWTVKKDGNPVMRLSANLTASGANVTRVTVDLTAPEGDAGGEIAERIAKYSTIKNMYVTAMKEQIAASLEGRDFNLSSVYPAMMAATAANMSELTANLQRGIEADQQRQEDNIARAYEREANGE